MNSEVIKQFLIKIGIKADNAEFAKFGSTVKTASVEANALGASLKTNLGGAADSVGNSFLSLRSKLLLATGGIAILGTELFHYVEKTAEGLENLNALSGRLNTSASQIEKLRYIAEINESSAAAAQSSLEGLARQAGNTYMGIGRFSARVFKQLGISVKDANGHLKNTYDLMFEVGRKIKGLEGGRQIAILSKLGIDPSLVKVLTSDIDEASNSFDNLYKSAGINLDVAAKNSNEFVDTMKELKYELGVIGKVVTLSIMPNLTKSVKAAADTFLKNLPQIKATMDPILKVVIKASSIILDFTYSLLQWASLLIRAFTELNKKSDGILAWVVGLSYGFSKLSKIIKSGPIGAILLLIGAFTWLQDDLKSFKETGKSVIDWNGHLGKSILWLTNLFTKYIPEIVGAIAGLYAFRTAMIALNIVMSANPIGIAIRLIGVALAVLLPIIIENWDSIKKVFTTAIDYIVGKIDYLTDKLKGVSDFMQDARNKSIKGLHLDGAFNWTHTGLGKATPTTALSPYIARSNSHSINQNTTIHVAGTANPQDTANAVAGQQKRVNADMTRNMGVVTR